ncbi:RDD family protein [Gordonia paraffinivorans]|uniref:RDD family protein n=1 Tax=Gordonia paraffinivorans TaxID=175628 RepID=UPI000D60844E|nr:RDD family protein [Gordonia paraffinivorans]MBY4575192.1 RDD family protein [Gordonia paraffinivorans]MCD2146337.1 RDD family protein [Gordonia paraffinivorans]PWD44840.1 RDD family protein [Gordonia paraffinivorans]
MTAEPKPGPAEPHAVHRAHAVQDRDKTAGIVSRGIAAFLDLLIVWMILGACYAGLSLLKFALTVSEFHFLHVDILFTTTGFVVTSVLYLAACWGVSGRTPGSVVMGLRVVDSTGGRVRPLVAVLRAVLCTVFAIGLVWVVVDRRRRSVADILLRTRVVYSR